jgi:hypothetical protein
VDRFDQACSFMGSRGNSLIDSHFGSQVVFDFLHGGGGTTSDLLLVAFMRSGVDIRTREEYGCKFL